MNSILNIFNKKIYKYQYVWTTEDNKYGCKFCEYINEHRDIFKNKVLINRIHKCKIVDILTERQDIEMYERMKNKRIQAFKKYMEK